METTVSNTGSHVTGVEYQGRVVQQVPEPWGWRLELPSYTSGYGGRLAQEWARTVVLEAAIQEGGWEPTP